MFFTITLAATAASAILGYTQSRLFVRRKLRFVDAVQNGGVPVLAGLGAALVAAPVVALLPLVGAGTAIIFGVSVGTGVASGVRDIRERRYLP
ncbi:MAG TPA: hypothetical protein VJU82_13715 [Acidobacteriaceae bacterium]|nr:hypothetical protein [Acidobacteriaceae bacterium]